MTKNKLTIWEDDDSPTWSTENFTVTDEAMGAMRVKIVVSDVSFPDFFPKQASGLHRWEAVVTHDDKTYNGVVSNTQKNVSLGYLYLTVAIKGW